MWKHKKVAAYTGTRNLYPMMVPAVKSLLVNSDVDEIWLFIEDDEFPKKYNMPEEIVKTRNVSNQRYFKSDGPNMNSHFTYMAMMRATFSKEFPDLDRILSLDVDTIIANDISEIWDLPIDDYYLSAAEEPSRTDELDYLYTNIGVCLYNLEKLRDGKADEVIEALNNKTYKYVEQDAFNELCQNYIYPLSPEYNSTIFTKVVSNPKIAHFAGEKRWNRKVIVQKYNDASWSEVMKYRKLNYGK